MKLETSHGIESEATPERIQELILNEEQRGDFIILSQEDQIYLQTTGENDKFHTEYRNGDEDQHFTSKLPLTGNELYGLMVRYLEKEPHWQDKHEWEPLKKVEEEQTTTWNMNWS